MEPTSTGAPSKLQMILSAPKLLGQAWGFYKQHGLQASVAAFNSKDAHPLIQFAKYGFSGVGALIVHTTALILLGKYFLAMGEDAAGAKNSMINNGIAFIFSNAFVYYLNTKWVFTPGRHSPVKEFLIFSVVNAPGAIAGTLIMAYLKQTYSFPVAFAGFVIPNILINFLCRKFFIFKK